MNTVDFRLSPRPHFSAKIGRTQKMHALFQSKKQSRRGEGSTQHEIKGTFAPDREMIRKFTLFNYIVQLLNPREILSKSSKVLHKKRYSVLKLGSPGEGEGGYRITVGRNGNRHISGVSAEVKRGGGGVYSWVIRRGPFSKIPAPVELKNTLL